MGPQQITELPSEYDTLHVGIALYDPETATVIDANRRFETILGYPTEELRGLSVGAYTANTYPCSGADFERRLHATGAGSLEQFTWRLKRGDGELIWAQIRLSGQTLAGEDCVRAELRDITDYYETYHRAELFWRLLRHNLRNEVNVIAGSTEQITANATTEPVREAGETIRSRVENLTSIAESVNEIERAVARTGTQRVRRHATEAVRSVADDVSATHPAAEITVEEREEMWIDVGDPFTYALTHALENAIGHSEESAPAVEVSIGPSPNTGRVELRVSDRNPPIPDDEIDAISTPGEITSTSHGSGVGLFVMKWCVESLGGEIRFERRSPRGNSVYFYLPPKAPPGRAG